MQYKNIVKTHENPADCLNVAKKQNVESQMKQTGYSFDTYLTN